MAGERPLEMVKHEVVESERGKSKEGGGGQEIDGEEGEKPGDLGQDEGFGYPNQSQSLGIMRGKNKIKLPEEKEKDNKENDLRDKREDAQKIENAGAEDKKEMDGLIAPVPPEKNQVFHSDEENEGGCPDNEYHPRESRPCRRKEDREREKSEGRN
mgnify:CR=1 FL=1